MTIGNVRAFVAHINRAFGALEQWNWTPSLHAVQSFWQRSPKKTTTWVPTKIVTTLWYFGETRMTKPKQRRRPDPGQRTMSNRDNRAIAPSVSRHSPRHDLHSDFSGFGRGGEDGDLDFMSDRLRHSSEE